MRPTWLCRSCAGKWPCNPARLALLAEFGTHRLALHLYLAGQYVDALADLSKVSPNTPHADLYDRFLGWPRARRQRG
jgi:hypothetical protein